MLIVPLILMAIMYIVWRIMKWDIDIIITACAVCLLTYLACMAFDIFAQNIGLWTVIMS